MDFWERVKKSAQDSGYKKLREKTEKGAHPSKEDLRGYVRNVLRDEDVERIMKHIALCGICANKALEIRVAEGHVEEDESGE